MKKLLSSIWPAIIWTILIFVLLIIPTNGLEGKDVNEIPNVDKFVHVILFAVFSFLWLSFVDSTNPINDKFILLAILILGSLYGLGMEFVQKYFTERSFSLLDALADTIGTAIGLVIKKSPYGNRGRNQN
jgi:VanZ family protein